MEGGDIKFSGQRPRFSNNRGGNAGGDDGGFRRAGPGESQSNGAPEGGMSAAAKPYRDNDNYQKPMRQMAATNGGNNGNSGCKLFELYQLSCLEESS